MSLIEKSPSSPLDLTQKATLSFINSTNSSQLSALFLNKNSFLIFQMDHKAAKGMQLHNIFTLGLDLQLVSKHNPGLWGRSHL